jgi:hypothetical protein
MDKDIKTAFKWVTGYMLGVVLFVAATGALTLALRIWL